jgi:hypothetical protein
MMGRSPGVVHPELYRVADGKLAEEWIASDMETLMRQLTGRSLPHTDAPHEH